MYEWFIIGMSIAMLVGCMLAFRWFELALVGALVVAFLVACGVHFMVTDEIMKDHALGVGMDYCESRGLSFERIEHNEGYTVVCTDGVHDVEYRLYIDDYCTRYGYHYVLGFCV